jgi:hypothetical protein
MESPLHSEDGDSHDEDRRESILSADSMTADIDKQVSLIAESSLSLALREVFGTILVDQFALRRTDPSRITIWMRFRSPRRLSEALATDQGEARPVDYGQAHLFLEHQADAALTELFRTVHIDEVAVDLHEMDQLACAITASVSTGALNS